MSTTMKCVHGVPIKDSCKKCFIAAGVPTGRPMTPTHTSAETVAREWLMSQFSYPRDIRLDETQVASLATLIERERLLAKIEAVGKCIDKFGDYDPKKIDAGYVVLLCAEYQMIEDGYRAQLAAPAAKEDHVTGS